MLRAGVLYAGAVWALAQGIAQLGPSVGAPDWVTRWFLVAAIIGFPFWLAFAWFFEFTPSGLKRESEIDPADSMAHATGRKLDFWIIGVLSLAVILLLTNQFVVRHDATSLADAQTSEAVAATLARAPDKSIAVLPLTSESGGPGQQDFSDGLSEELISDLTQINSLKVIGRYSSFKFRNSTDSPAQIGARLGVAHLLSGSVRQQGQRVRIQVDLIKASDGSSVWSQTYDRELKDVFAIQSEIGQAVAGAMKIQLLGQSLVADDRPPSGDVEAYRLILQARAIGRRASTEADNHTSIALATQALQRDPGYAYGWALLGNTLVVMANNYLQGTEQQAASAQARAAINKALTLAPDRAFTHAARANLLFLDGDALGGLASARRALALAPNDGLGLSITAYALMNVGQLQASVDMYRRALTTDPLRSEWYLNLSNALLAQGQLDAAELALQQTLNVHPQMPTAHLLLTELKLFRHDSAAAQVEAARESDPDAKALALAMVAQAGSDRAKADAALHDFMARYTSTQPYYVADLYALRKEPTPMFAWLERARTAQLAIVVITLLNDPVILSYKDDPRFTALCKKIGLPPPGTVLPASSMDTPKGTP